MNINDPYIYSRGYIFLPLTLDTRDLHEDLVLFGDTYYLKSEFHISLVCVKLIMKQYPNIKVEDVLGVFNRFTNETALDDVMYLNEYRVATHSDGRKSILQKVDIPNIEEFYEILREKLSVTTDTLPVHVTIYTNNKDDGIGINTRVDYDNTTEIRFR